MALRSEVPPAGPRLEDRPRLQLPQRGDHVVPAGFRDSELEGASRGVHIWRVSWEVASCRSDAGMGLGGDTVLVIWRFWLGFVFLFLFLKAPTM